MSERACYHPRGPGKSGVDSEPFEGRISPAEEGATIRALKIRQSPACFRPEPFAFKEVLICFQYLFSMQSRRRDVRSCSFRFSPYPLSCLIRQNFLSNIMEVKPDAISGAEGASESEPLPSERPAPPQVPAVNEDELSTSSYGPSRVEELIPREKEDKAARKERRRERRLKRKRSESGDESSRVRPSLPSFCPFFRLIYRFQSPPRAS